MLHFTILQLITLQFANLQFTNLQLAMATIQHSFFKCIFSKIQPILLIVFTYNNFFKQHFLLGNGPHMLGIEPHVLGNESHLCT